MSEIFEQLESNDKKVVENAKQTLRDLFKKVNEPWLLNGLYDNYLNTNSVRFMDILVNIKEPHHNYLFDKLHASLKCQKTEVKVQALMLLGHVARCQPTWLYKLPEHNLLQEILKLLKNEDELVPLISALLVLIILLPMIPSSMGEYLTEVFEIFSRLAGWNCSGKFIEDQMIHMQVALYALFLRLYGMYPCNLVTYLRKQYKDRHNPVFVHTIKPMLDTVRMHPSLVTASEDNETTTERWKKMGVHDVIVECERFSLDLTDRCPHDACQYPSGFRSRSGTTNSSMEPSYQMQNLKHLLSATPNTENSFFTPSNVFHTASVTETAPTNIPQPHVQGAIQSSNFPSQEGTSPPEAAIEATPETTPVRDVRLTPRAPPLSTNVARALTSFGNKSRASGSVNTTPTHSQPSSPMRKDYSQFNFSAENRTSTSSAPKLSTQKLHSLIKERAQVNEGVSDLPLKVKNLPPPTSPLRIKTDVGTRHGSHQRTESPVSQEDDEVSSIVTRSESAKRPLVRCDSILHDDSSDTLDDEQEHGSPCTEGGLHMPNSKSMNSFAKNMQRLRYHSQCNAESDKTESSAGSSPGNCVPFSSSTTVRRANSCPEMKKSPVISTKDNMGKPLDETDEEETISEDQMEKNSGTEVQSRSKKVLLSSKTQTDNFWPMPYEHMFFNVFPALETSEIKPSPAPSAAPSPAPLNLAQETYQPSIYEILDKYVETAINTNERDNKQNLKDNLQLLHQQLLFERHRRETHAYRNRRLLADAKSTRLLEECNSALRDQVHLHQREIENLQYQLDGYKRDRSEEEKKSLSTIQYWEKQYKLVQQECTGLKEKNEQLEKEFNDLKSKCADLEAEKQQTESSLLDAIAEANIAREQAWAGEKGRTELEQVNKELLLIGELQIQYQERLSKLSSMRRCSQELDHVKQVYSHELKTLNHQLENKFLSLEACQTRIGELDGMLGQKEELISTLKRSVNGLNEEHHEKLKAVESKYQSQLSVNRALEERMLELLQKYDILKKRCETSPNTSSCHEVNVTTTDRTAGLSAHSSPLSASLASSEGSMAFHEAREVKNLQALVDQTSTKSRQSDEIEMLETDGQLASSTKND